ncbi:MAG TPA: sigma-70 family RNA polymerase sigma factor [Gemmataceae bacterium]|nr:sigma-70 family RNA polymerase sigma factor [Gemmataceae bacterium]
MSEFKNPAMRQLADQQMRFAPPARRLDQLARAEKLLTQIEHDKQYPYQYICFRITEFRPTSYPDLRIDGNDLEHDLYAFIEALSRSTPAVPVESMPEPVLTLEQVSEQLHVSTKTISRWRQRGLVGRRILRNGRRQVGYLKSMVDRFLTANKDRVERSARFSQLSDDEKEDILRRAKRLARVSSSTLTEISRRIARRLGRSPETVRYTIKNHDRAHPEQALFPAVTGVLDAQTKQTLFSLYRRGIPVETLAKRFQRTRTSVYRILNEVRAQRLLAQPLEYIPSPAFDDPAAEMQIMGRMPNLDEYETQRRQMRIPKDAPPELASLYEMPLLNKEQEQHLFRKMNYLKHKANQLRGKLDPAHARIQDIKQIEDLQMEATAIKDQLISSNMRLVVAIAKRHAAQTDNFFELLSDGNMSLIRAVEKFDYSRGNKFSTYASWAIMKNFARSIPEEKRRRERYVTGHEEMFEIAPDTRSDEQELVASVEQSKNRVNRLLQYLDPRERQIIQMRAGLDNYSEGMTLEEIGQQLGITKERVRQLNVRIMNKLRTIAKEQKIDMP